MKKIIMVLLVLCIHFAACTDPTDPPPPTNFGLSIQNGWYVQNNRVIWGYAQHNGWWGDARANITRRAPGQVGPNLTEDLDLLTDNMLNYAYPGFEHNYGLWYDRRRDNHYDNLQPDGNVESPFLEQPWARSGTGTAWDGLSKYDLTQYNEWYFSRLREFADHCDSKGTILFHNFYMQHALLERQVHYCDFPWRPINTIQLTLMPDLWPAANAFYNVDWNLRRNAADMHSRIHWLYIRKCLDVLGDNTNVVFFPSEEYTGPLAFVQFWFDSILEWEQENNKTVHIGMSSTKDVLDAILADPNRGPRVETIDLRYWWYNEDGSLYAPPGGVEVAGRYAAGYDASQTTPQQIYRQVKEYRLAYPDKAILHAINASRERTWAFLMGGGSMLIRRLQYSSDNPPAYEPPEDYPDIQHVYNFINDHLAEALPRTIPKDLVQNSPDHNWCLAETGKTYLVYALEGGTIKLDLSSASGTFRAQWLDPSSGNLTDANGGQVQGGTVVTFTAPVRSGSNDWALYLTLN